LHSNFFISKLNLIAVKVMLLGVVQNKINNCGRDFNKKAFRNFSTDSSAVNKFDSAGTVVSVIDGIARVKGLFSVGFAELVEFTSSDVGMVLSIESNYVQVVLFGNDRNILPGDSVKRKYSSLEIYVSFDFLGRVVNSLGEFIDGKSLPLAQNTFTYKSLSEKANVLKDNFSQSSAIAE
jgi:F0F1-type ATP synthase alpha subunit